MVLTVTCSVGVNSVLGVTRKRGSLPLVLRMREIQTIQIRTARKGAIGKCAVQAPRPWKARVA